MFWVGSLQPIKRPIHFSVNMARQWDSEFDDTIKDEILKECS